MDFSGVYPALMTPFDRNDEVNTAELKRLCEYNIAKGVSGFYVDGSTAEAFLLSYEERKTVLKTVAGAAAGKCRLIAHIGCISTKQAAELAVYARDCGYDAVSSVAPFYYKFSFDEIKEYYFTLAEKSGLPVVIYNIPSFSGVSLTVEQMGEFLGDDRFAGVKHTSADYFALRRFKTAFPDKYIFNGFDETFLAGLSMGADGAIGSTFNFMAEKFIEIQRLFLANDVKAAAALQEEADVIISALCGCGVMQGEKVILNELGFDFGTCRAPFRDITEEQKKKLLDTVMPLL